MSTLRFAIGLTLMALACACTTAPKQESSEHLGRLSRAEEVLAASDVPVTTTVSLTFDDTLADQYQAGALLGAHGMRGTFYTISSRVGLDSNSMSLAQLLDLQNQGHEIAGHTLSHPDVATLSADDARREVCNGRVDLLNKGLRAENFAYPFGSPAAQSPLALDVQQIVADCGYNSARGTGDIVSPGSCFGCPYADSIPPGRAFHIRTPDSVKIDTPLEQMQGYVTQAEEHGGGWVVIVMHHVCNGCNPYSVSYQTLSDFLDWLAPRAANGTVVRTVAEVMGDDLKPGVAGPPRPLPSPGANLLPNPSLETDANHDGLPDCWQKGGSGTNVFTFAETADAAAGAVAERVDITSLTSGARRLVVKQDTGLCAPQVYPGHQYDVSASYKASVPPRFIAYYLNTAHAWIQWAQGPSMPAQPSYAQASWLTPPLPSDAIALSIGASIFAVGTLYLDDLALRDHDAEAPSVAISAPGDGSSVMGTITLSAVASDPGGVDHVEFWVDGQRVPGVVQSAGNTFSLDWNTTLYPDGNHAAITARAYDLAGNVASSAGILLTIANAPPSDNVAPTIALTSPAAGASVQGVQLLSAGAADDRAVQHVSFLVNGALLANVDTPPYEASWDTTTTPEGSVSLTAVAYDTAGNSSSSTRTVLVDRTAPQVTLISPAEGAAVSGDVLISADAGDNLGNVQVEFFVNGASIGTAVESPWTVTFPTLGLADGTALEIVAVASDAFGQTTTSPIRNVVVDNSLPDSEPPVSSIACDGAPCSDGYYRAAIQVSLAAIDPGSSGLASIVYTTDGSTPTTTHGVRYNGEISLTSDTVVTVRAFDGAGNSENPHSLLIRVDGQAPLTSLFCDGAPCVSGWHSHAVTVTAQTTDVGSSGLARLGYSFDGADACASDASAYIAPLYVSSSTRLNFCSADLAGNVEGVKSLDVGIDLTAPFVQVTCDGAACSSGWYKSPVTVALAALASGPAPVDVIRVTTDGTASASGAPYTTPFVIGSPTTLRATALNLAGTPSAELSQTLLVDTTVPQIVVASPVNGANVTGTQAINTVPSDDVGVVRVRFYLDGKQLGTRVTAPWKWNWDTSTTSKGSHTLSVRAEDAAGNGTTSPGVNVVVR